MPQQGAKPNNRQRHAKLLLTLMFISAYGALAESDAGSEYAVLAERVALRVERGEYPAALGVMERMHALKPENTDLLFDVGRLYGADTEAYDRDKAVEALERYLVSGNPAPDRRKQVQGWIMTLEDGAKLDRSTLTGLAESLASATSSQTAPSVTDEAPLSVPNPPAPTDTPAAIARPAADPKQVDALIAEAARQRKDGDVHAFAATVAELRQLSPDLPDVLLLEVILYGSDTSVFDRDKAIAALDGYLQSAGTTLPETRRTQIEGYRRTLTGGQRLALLGPAPIPKSEAPASPPETPTAEPPGMHSNRGLVVNPNARQWPIMEPEWLAPSAESAALRQKLGQKVLWKPDVVIKVQHVWPGRDWIWIYNNTPRDLKNVRIKGTIWKNGQVMPLDLSFGNVKRKKDKYGFFEPVNYLKDIYLPSDLPDDGYITGDVVVWEDGE